MKTIGVILAKSDYKDFPGKPLAEINGRPLLSWVFYHANGATTLDEVIVATENESVTLFCITNKIKCIKTSDASTLTKMLNEVAQEEAANYYVYIDVSEPMLTAAAIDDFVKKAIEVDFPVAHAMTRVEGGDIKDNANIKVIRNTEGNLLTVTRDKPQQKMEKYFKLLGLGLYNNRILDLYGSLPQRNVEREARCEVMRFVENNIPVKMVEIDCPTITVNNLKDVKLYKKITL